jgi:hypothetical protein
MNHFVTALLLNPPPAPARGGPDPLLAVRRSFGEGDNPTAPMPSRLPARPRTALRGKSAAARP